LKFKIHLIIITVIVAGFAILGLSKRSSYTNITAEEDFMNDFYVAEIPTSLAANDCLSLKASLPESPVILKVIPVDSPENFFAGRQQKVTITHVYAGDGLKVGDEIYITTYRGQVDMQEHAIMTGFVNDMKKSEEYLVFLTEPIGISNDKITPVFYLQMGSYINPVFSLAAHDNVIYPVSGDTTYVPYSEVSENEFFATEQEGLDAFLELKEEMLALFP